LRSLSAPPPRSKDGGTVKIADFGTAVFVEASSEAAAKTAGTPAFFSPEMCEMGLAGKYDGRACDMWALGVTLHIWCYGRPPFLAATPMLLMAMIKVCGVRWSRAIRARRRARARAARGPPRHAASSRHLPAPRARARPTAQDCPERVPLPKGGRVSALLKRVMQELLTRDWTARMTLNQLRLHPWLTKHGQFPLSAQPTALVAVSDAEIASAITPLMQVSGHEGALERAGGTTLVKKSTSEEYVFYTRIAASDIAPHVPILYGMQEEAPPRVGSLGRMVRATRHSETAVDEPMGECKFLLQDLTSGMGSPCVMDIKMGKRTALESDHADTRIREDLLRKMVRAHLARAPHAGGWLELCGRARSRASGSVPGLTPACPLSRARLARAPRRTRSTREKRGRTSARREASARRAT
jgi:hypothetical protein